MTGTLRALGCGVALVFATGGFASPPPQSATFNLGAQSDAFIVSVSSFGKKFTVDPDKLHFTIRTRGAKGAGTPLGADVGEPILDRSFDQDRSGTLTSYHLPIAFPKRPTRPGMYDVAVVAERGFARYDDGAELPVEGRPHADVYWPDEAGADAGLRAARAALENRTVYGYGGIELSCGVASFKTYLANVGVTVQSVGRRHGAVQMWTGAMPSWGNDAAYSFFAVDPIAVRASYPTSASFGSGGSSQPAGDAPCPGFFLADPWHLDVTLTTSKPPRLPAGYGQFKIATGMTRADVAWRRGYPQGYSSRAAFSAQSVWTYDDGPGDAYTVTFRSGRVVAFTVPPGLP